MGNIPPEGDKKAVVGKSRNFSFSVPATATTMNFTVGWPPAVAEEQYPTRKHNKRRNDKQIRSPSPVSNIATAYDSQDSCSTCSDEISAGGGSNASSGRFSGFSIYSTPSYEPWGSQIHALVDSVTTPLIWDVRCSLSTLSSSRSVSKIYGPNALSFPVTSSGAGHIRILSKHFPWTIDVGPKERAITASDVLRELHDLLHIDLDDAIWGIIDDNTRASVERARQRRSPTDEKIKNVDLLGKRVMFQGFRRDDNFVRQRLLPGAVQVAETWLLELGKS